MRGVRILTVASLVTACLPAAAHAAGTYFVDAASAGGPCSDSRPAVQAASLRTPWCSLPRAIRAVPSGSTVLVRGGSHPKLSLRGDNRRSSMVTLRRFGAETVRLDGIELEATSLLRLEGFTFSDAGVLRDGVSRVAIVGNDFAGQPLWLDDTSGVLVERNHIHDIPASASAKIGIRLMRDRGTVVRANRIENVVDDPIQVTDVAGVLLEGNVLLGAHPAGREHVDCIQVLGAAGLTIRGNHIRDVEHCLMFTDFQASGVTIENNVIADVEGTAMKADGTHGMPNLRLLNNTFHAAGHGVDLRIGHPGAVVANNIFDKVSSLGDQPVATHNLVARARRGSDYGDHAILSAPAFTDRWTLELAPGSAGIDAGTSAYGPATDLLGRPRANDPQVGDTGAGPTPYADVGALERTLPRPAVAPGPAQRRSERRRRARLLVPRRLRVRSVRRSGIRVRVRTRASVRRVSLSLRRRGADRRVARAVGRARRGRATLRLRPRRVRPRRYVITARLRDRTGRRVARTSVRVRLVR